jgi:hypothetical protein
VIDNNDGSYGVQVVLDSGTSSTTMNLSILGTSFSTDIFLVASIEALPAVSGWWLGMLIGLVLTLGWILLRSHPGASTNRPR